MDAKLFRTGELKVFQHDRIVITGANGVGKSLFVRLLRRAIEGETGRRRDRQPIGRGRLCRSADVAASGQRRRCLVSSPDSSGRAINAASACWPEPASIWTAQRRPIARLSPGQKARLGLLALRLTEPNFYLMDEPTNHVDIAGQERLEAEILAHEATCVLVSHDRFFVGAIATRVLKIEDGRVVEE